MAVADHLRKYDSWNSFSDEVLCLCISRDQNILTGHELKVKVWCWDSKHKTSKESIEVEVQGNVTCISQFPRDTAFAVSVDQSVLIYQYDVVDKVVTSLSLKDRFCFNEDEINEIDIHSKGSFICSCDDNGDVKVIDIDGKKIVHTLTNFHSGICSTVKFSLKKPWELVSGGLDCTIGRWDFNRGRLLATACTKQGASSDALIVNPPMVHSLDVFSTHHSFICGLGDGRLVAYSLKSPKGMDKMCQVHAHHASVACVRCIELKEPSSKSTSLYVVSIGNDGMLCAHKCNLSDSAGQNTMLLVGQLCSIPKVNNVDILYEADTVLVFTADVTGSVSVYIFSI